MNKNEIKELIREVIKEEMEEFKKVMRRVVEEEVVNNFRVSEGENIYIDSTKSINFYFGDSFMDSFSIGD